MAMEDATVIKYHPDNFVLRDVASGEEYTLRGEMLVGREVECAIAIHSGHVSRYHAKINVSRNGVYLEDLHSTNGTFVNSKKIKGRVRLNVGDEVTFDSVNFRFASTKSGNEDQTQLAPVRHSLAAGRPQNQSFSPYPSEPEAYSSPEVEDSDELFPELSPELISESIPESLEDLVADSKPEPVKPKSAPPAKDAATPHQAVPPKQAKPDPVANPPASSYTPQAEAAEELPETPTQMLSPGQLDRLVERNRYYQKDINQGSGPRLIIMTAPLRGKLFEFDKAPTGTTWKIGRDHNSDICLSDKTISTDHARLSKEANGYLLMATHAKNGILINGHPNEKAFLRHGDRIQMGNTELMFKTDLGSDQATRVVDVESASIRKLRWLLAGGVFVFLIIVAAILAASN